MDIPFNLKNQNHKHNQKHKQMKKTFLILLITLFVSTMNAQNINLPTPQKKGGKPLMEALAERKSNRTFSEQKLTEQELSNLLWAANGINREDGRRTAPSARNCQEIEIYVIMPEATYLYDYKEHKLTFVKKGDFRTLATNDFAHKAPIFLLYVANYDKMKDMSNETRDLYSATDCGNVSQNVYLYCTSAGFNTVALGNINREKAKEEFGFNGKAILGQPVGK
jgi:SagB-type dehydrogenase family enzyme